MAIYTATADVTNGSTTVTINTGAGLSEFNCTPDSVCIIAGVSYFIAARIDTLSFELTRPYEGVTGEGVSLEISPLTQISAKAVNLAAALSDAQAQIKVLDRNSQGLFFYHIGVTGDADPGPGNLALDSSDPSVASAIYIDNLDANSAHRDVTALLARLDVGTTIRLRSLASTAYYEFDVTGTAGDRGGWYAITLSPVGHSGVIGDGEPVSLSWVRSGEGLEADASGTLAGRAAYDNEAGGFIYMASDGDGAQLDGTVLFVKNSGSAGDWSAGFPLTGPQGSRGWAPRLAVVADGARRVLQLSGYIAGQGTVPTAGVGQYIGATGLTSDIENAIDIRGITGQSAYQVAVGAGFVGNQAAWLESLIGDSAYEVAVANGFAGNEAAWLASLVGVDGTDPGALYNWSETVDDADPGAGYIAADNGDLSAATTLFVSKTNRAGDDLSAFLLGLAASTNAVKGVVTLTRSGGNAQMTANVTGISDATGYVKVTIDHQAGANGFITDDAVSFQFSPAGDQGGVNAVSLASTIAAAGEKAAPVAGDKVATLDSEDGDKLVWVDASKFGGGGAGMHNCLINPLFEVNQRAVAGAVTLAAGEYGHDRWKAGAGGCSYTFSTSNNGGGYTITITSGSLLQRIEVQTFAGRLGDYVLSWTGTAQARIDAGAYGDSGEVTAAINGSAHVTVEFGTGTVSVPQLEHGATPTAFSRRHPGQELLLCQRYYNRLALVSRNCIPITYRTSKIAEGVYHHPMQMRAAPSVSYTGAPDIFGMGTENLSSLTFDANTMFTAVSWNDSGSPFNQHGGYGLGGTGFTINFDAEL